VAASWTTGGEEDGLALYRRAYRVTDLDLRTLASVRRRRRLERSTEEQFGNAEAM
jgi:hypothetical protein